MFRSFFLAGFEGSTGYNRHGQWFDQVVATGHDRTVDEDYRQLAALDIHAARETIRWPLVDLGHGRYDFSTVEPFVEAARRHGVEVIWDLFHYGYPQGLDLWSEEFQKRFADYCYAIGRYIAARTEGTCAFTPVNEPSFMAYAGGEKGLFAPHETGRGWDLKVTLTRAAIEGINALWAASPGARIVNVDPLCRVAPPPDRPDLEEARATSTSASSSRAGTCSADGSCRSSAVAGPSRCGGHQLLLDEPVGMGCRAACRRGHSTARRGRSAPMAPRRPRALGVDSAMAAR